MAIDERARHELYLRLEEHLGAEAAATLMEHLPPVGWADVATKRDLDHLRELREADLERTAQTLRAEFHKTIATHTVVIVFATMATSIASVFAAAQLT
jgi:hypothetical protein